MTHSAFTSRDWDTLQALKSEAPDGVHTEISNSDLARVLDITTKAAQLRVKRLIQMGLVRPFYLLNERNGRPYARRLEIMSIPDRPYTREYQRGPIEIVTGDKA